MVSQRALGSPPENLERLLQRFIAAGADAGDRRITWDEA